MKMQHWMQRAVPLAAVALVGMAPMAFAQGQELFEWNGRVDREVQVMMQGNRVWTNNIGDNETGRARARAMSMMPRQDGQVVVQVLNGRGNVDVIQQPAAQNGFTTIVRIRDPQSGSSDYRIAAYWQSYANGDVYNRRDRDDMRPDRDRDRDNNNNGSAVYNGDRSAMRDAYGMRVNEIMHWRGNVDDELEIRIQNGQVSYNTVKGNPPTSIQLNPGNMTMPGKAARVAVAQNTGRGQVVVVQQPSPYNGYTTVLHVRDPQNGYGYYDFDLLWTP